MGKIGAEWVGFRAAVGLKRSVVEGCELVMEEREWRSILGYFGRYFKKFLLLEKYLAMVPSMSLIRADLPARMQR